MNDPVKYITDDQGERTAVVLPISDYEKLLEDLDDLAVVAERRAEAAIPHEQFVSELKHAGLLVSGGAHLPEKVARKAMTRLTKCLYCSL
jgi:hypothetical protein